MGLRKLRNQVTKTTNKFELIEMRIYCLNFIKKPFNYSTDRENSSPSASIFIYISYHKLDHHPHT